VKVEVGTGAGEAGLAPTLPAEKEKAEETSIMDEL
jgi:hypothetical protein